MIIVNFKRYVSGQEAVSLATLCKKYGAIACPQLIDLVACVETGAECWTQKYEPTAEGNTGTLLNHSDYRVDTQTLEKTLLEIENLTTCVCCATVEEGMKIDELRPDFLAFEPPELIGNKEKSVATEKPKVINAQDVKSALEMGAKGILVATDVVKAKDPEKELRELVMAFSNSK